MKLTIGHSYDVHQLVEGRKLILGGIEIPHDKGLLGHSDADVLLHAIIEAIIGAMSMGDIGTLFPDTDPKFKGISSMKLLVEVIDIMTSNGYRINNIDSTVYLENPKLRPFIEKMRANIAIHINIDIEDINIKATRGERLGFIGREEGMAAEAVVLLAKDLS